MGTDVQKISLRIVGHMALGLALIVLAGCGGQPAGGPQPAKPATGIRLFFDWPQDRKPDLVLLLSGEQHGYPMPCGCSDPQYGGLDRRYNFLESLKKERDWPIVAIDLGDVADLPKRYGPQTKLKYKYLMDGLQMLNYAAIGVGENEMRMPFLDALGEYALNKTTPQLLAANLHDRQGKFPRDAKTSMIGSWISAGGKDKMPKVGIAGVVGRTVAAKVQDPDVKFDRNDQVLPVVLQEMANANTELNVLLYQGTLEEAQACADAFPQFHIVQCQSLEEEPPGKPEKGKTSNALVIRVGHKGRDIGLVGVYRTGNAEKPFDFYYQLVSLGPEYKTAPGKEADNPILTMLEEYTKDVQRGNYVAKYFDLKTPHPIQMEPEFKDAIYVGSEKCKGCHEHAYKVWKNSPHAHAYESLVKKATHPSLRQFDGECVSCHVTGFGYNTGFKEEKETHLLNNGCENCHGPCSIHVKGGQLGLNPKLLALMNPHKTHANETAEQTKRRELALEISCLKCHDGDNDAHWKLDKWKLIDHKEPKDAPAP